MRAHGYISHSDKWHGLPVDSQNAAQVLAEMSLFWKEKYMQ